MIDDIFTNAEHLDSTCSEECSCSDLKKKIASVLRRYFKYDDTGRYNDEYDPNCTALQALEEIHEIIGEI